MAHWIIERITASHERHRCPPSGYKSKGTTLPRFSFFSPHQHLTTQQWPIHTLPSLPTIAPLLNHLSRQTGPMSLQATMSSSTSSPCKSTPSPKYVPRYSYSLLVRFVPPVPVLLSKFPQRVSYSPSLTYPLQNAAPEQVY